MSKLGTEFKVGLFTLLSAVVIGYMFIFLVPDFLDNKKYNTYYAIVENASGIVAKTHVRTNGVTVGKVETLELEASSTKLTLEVDEEVKIPKNSKVEIRTRGLLGETFIEIVRGPDTGQYYSHQETIPTNTGQLDMQELIALVGDIAQDVKKVTSTFANTLGTKKGAQSIENIVDNIEKFTKEVKTLVSENRKDVRAMIQNFQETSATLKNVIGGNEQDLNAIIANIRTTTEDLRSFGSNIKEIVSGENRDKIDKIIAQFDNTMTDVEATAKNIRLVSTKLEQGDGTLGKLINNDDALTEFEGAIKDIRDVIAPVRELQVAVDYHLEVRNDKTTQNYFDLVFKTRPDKYFLVGFTDVGEREVITRRPQVNNQPGEDGRLEEREFIEDKKALRFNLQFAKRWYDLSARFGLFESTGGFAIDYHLWDDRIRFSVEAFDWDSQSTVRQTARLKAYANILFFNHVFAVIGVDDIQRYKEGTKEVNPEKNTYIGAGLTFNDQDLKTLFGTAAVALQ